MSCFRSSQHSCFGSPSLITKFCTRFVIIRPAVAKCIRAQLGFLITARHDTKSRRFTMVRTTEPTKKGGSRLRSPRNQRTTKPVEPDVVPSTPPKLRTEWYGSKFMPPAEPPSPTARIKCFTCGVTPSMGVALYRVAARLGKSIGLIWSCEDCSSDLAAQRKLARRIAKGKIK